MTAAAQPERILVIKLGALGDFIQALGPMAAIRAHHRNAHITLLTTAPFENLARQSGYCDEIWIDERPRWLNIAGWMALKNRLNKGGFRRIYDLQNNDRTAFYFRLLSLKNRPEWVGAAPGASHRNASPLRAGGHAFDGHVQTLALAGIRNVKPDPLEWMKADIGIYPLRKPYILMVPGSAPQRPEKRWPSENYARLAKILAGMGYQPVLLGTAAEHEVLEKICAECPDALDLCAQTDLQEIAALARHAAAAIGNDTGPLHLIAATGCPVLALFSQQSDPVKHAPKGSGVQILQAQDLENLKVEKVLKLLRPRQEPPRPSVTMH